MTMSDRPSLDLFRAMFPGDPARGAPAAAATAAVANLKAHFDRLDDIDALLRGGTAGDPNDVLKALKARALDLIDRFVEQAVIAYFSDPTVSRALTGKPTPLFPNHTVMPDIDYDLLEPVLANCRGHADD
jgi:hypothetical protein